MNIENQVVSLDLALKLNDARCPQIGVWSWVPILDAKKETIKWKLQLTTKPSFGKKLTAYTLSELISLLCEYEGEAKQTHRLCLMTPDTLAKWWLIRKENT